MKSASARLYLPFLALLFAALACNLGSSSDTVETPDAAPTTPADTPVPAPTATQPPPPTSTPSVQFGDEFRSESGGFAFLELPGWSTLDEFSFIAHQPADADPELGPVILMSPSLSESDRTLDDVYENFAQGFDTGEGGNVVLGEPFNTEVAGFPAREVDLSGATEDGSAMLGRLLVIQVSPRQALEIFAYAVADRWGAEVFDLYTAYVGTLSFFDPIVEDSSPDGPTGELLRQWGGYAVASTQYGDSSWAAFQATGAPDVYPECGDFASAWAMADYDTLDWIEVDYPRPVIPTEINIYETYNPGRVVGVDVVTQNGEYTSIYKAAPETVDDCPSILTIYPNIDYPIIGILIYVDTVGLGDWAEIDAVELVGYPIAP